MPPICQSGDCLRPLASRSACRRCRASAPNPLLPVQQGIRRCREPREKRPAGGDGGFVEPLLGQTTLRVSAATVRQYGERPTSAQRLGGGCEDDCGKLLFDRSQFTAIANRIGRLQGRFIMSINDRSEVRELFQPFELTEVRLSYTVSASGGVPAKELIMRGWTDQLEQDTKECPEASGRRAQAPLFGYKRSGIKASLKAFKGALMAFDKLSR